MHSVVVPCGHKVATAPCPLEMVNPVRMLEVMPIESESGDVRDEIWSSGAVIWGFGLALLVVVAVVVGRVVGRYWDGIVKGRRWRKEWW